MKTKQSDNRKNSCRDAMLLYAVTDRRWTGNQTLLEQVESALRGGVTCIQLREKGAAEEEFLAEAIAMKKLCQEYQTPFIINDNVNIAIKCSADGVHVGQNDMNVRDVRALVGENMIIGVSARTVEQALAAEAAGADYLGTGAVFSTATKTNACALSHQTLTEICQAVQIPVVAIGGIDKNNILQLSGSGVDGVALVSAVFAAEQIEEECRLLKNLSRKITAKEDGTLAAG